MYSEENKTIIRALNKYGRVPEQWELLNMIEELEKKIDKAIEYIKEDIKANYFKRYDDEVYKMCDDLLEILGDKKMSLHKAIKSGKEHRVEYGTKNQPYCKAIDPSCRNHGNCKWCENNRTHKSIKIKEIIKNEIKEINNEDIKR